MSPSRELNRESSFPAGLKLCLLGALSAIIYAFSFSTGDFLTSLGILSRPPEKITSHLIELIPLTVFYILAWRLVGRIPEGGGRKILPGILLFAVLFRLPLIFQAPWLSTDVYRYLWDGRVQVLGRTNPYLHAPDSDALVKIRDPLIYPNINRKGSRTIYPAGAQLLFQALNRSGLDTPPLFKAAALGAEALAVFILLAILQRLNVPQAGVLVYAWNPLVVYELFHSGHLEAFMLPPLLGSVYFFLRRRLVTAGALLGLAAAIKLLPALILFATPRRDWAKVVPPFLAVVVLAYSPYLSAGGKILGFLPTYFSDPGEIFNLGPLQGVLLGLAKSLSLSPTSIRYLLASALLALLIQIVRKSDDRPEALVPRICHLFAVYFLLIYPAFHPWYLVPLIPFLSVAPSRGWIFLSLALPLSYFKYLSPEGRTPIWVTLIQFIPTYTLLISENESIRILISRRLRGRNPIPRLP